MKYIRVTVVEPYRPHFKEEITREAAVAEIGEEALKALEHRTANEVSATQIVSANDTDYEIGVEF